MKNSEKINEIIKGNEGLIFKSVQLSSIHSIFISFEDTISELEGFPKINRAYQNLLKTIEDERYAFQDKKFIEDVKDGGKDE
jgi:hypothetical protein